MSPARPAAHALSEAETRAREARTVADHPGLQAAFKRLEADYMRQIRISAPDKATERESAYFMLRALDALRADIAATLNGAAVTQRNLRSRLVLKRKSDVR